MGIVSSSHLSGRHQGTPSTIIVIRADHVSPLGCRPPAAHAAMEAVPLPSTHAGGTPRRPSSPRRTKPARHVPVRRGLRPHWRPRLRLPSSSRRARFTFRCRRPAARVPRDRLLPLRAWRVFLVRLLASNRLCAGGREGKEVGEGGPESRSCRRLLGARERRPTGHQTAPSQTKPKRGGQRACAVALALNCSPCPVGGTGAACPPVDQPEGNWRGGALSCSWLPYLPQLLPTLTAIRK